MRLLLLSDCPPHGAAGETADVPDEAARDLIGARLAEPAEPAEPAKAGKKG